MDRTSGYKYGSQRLGERRDAGAEWRRKVPLAAHAEWKVSADRADPVEVLIEQGKNRIAELLPVRHGRMKADAFAFMRGAAAVMAADLASGLSTGLRVQACGDCHLGNFGGYASPEGTPLFDVNDFDETLPAPFEWDVKRLAASLAVAGRVAKLPGRECRRLAHAATESYRRHLAELALLSPLHAWSSRIDLVAAMAEVDSDKVRKKIERRRAAVLAGAANHFGLVERKNGDWKIKDRPPLVRHLSHHELHAHKAFVSYAETLQEDRRVLLRRYHRRDVAFKTVGVGSVGTFCAIGLFVADDGSPLLLQVKEAQESVLAPFAGASDYANHGERVVVGQRMMQAATDIFLGWTQNRVDGRFFYVRRLKDSRLANLGALLREVLPYYAKLCGRTLARAHARAGDAVALSGYMGDDSEFDKAIAEFALAYADQTERDWRALLDAIKAGRISAEEQHAS
ncbi:MAG: DUF2252 domain-containing protein [Alphaproteobacteria bacterium]|nr:DUF2252 domain-containing protein [Alphaproteobacteria bacterium]